MVRDDGKTGGRGLKKTKERNELLSKKEKGGKTEIRAMYIEG